MSFPKGIRFCFFALAFLVVIPEGNLRLSLTHTTGQPALVAIDLGAESCRVSLLRWHDSQPTVSLVYRFPNQPRVVDGGLRWDLSAIEAGLHQGLRAAASLAPEGIRAIAVDGWAVDYVYLGAQGRALADPFCYRDERTIAAEEELHGIISPEQLRELTGVQLLRINTLYQQYADILAHGTQPGPWLNLPEYILYRLGGRPVAELTNASHSQMLDLTTPTWCQEIFTSAGLTLSLAPDLVPPGTQLGQLTGELGEFPAFGQTTLIAPACHDTASAIAGIPFAGDDWVYISSGTWSLVGTTLAKPINTPAAREDNFTNLQGVGGTICFHKNVNGMWLLRQSIDHWAAEGTAWPVTDLITDAATALLPEGILEVDDPDLLLPGDMPGRINTQRRRLGYAPLDESAANAPAFAALIFHGLAARYAQVIERLRVHSGKTFTKIVIVGGASQNLLLNHLTARATGLEVIRGSQESSTLGNFAVQLASLDQPSGPVTAEAVATWAGRLQHSIAPHP